MRGLLPEGYPSETTDSLSQEQITALCEAMPEGIVVHDSTGRIVHHNQAALRVLGLTSDQLRGRSSVDPQWRTLREDLTDYPGEEHPAMVVLRTGLPKYKELMGCFRGAGELRWLEINALPVLTGDKLTHVLVSFRDITEDRKTIQELEKLKEELEERGKFLHTTLSALPCLVSYVDRNYVYRYVNSTYQAWFGASPDSFIGKPMVDGIGADAFDRIRPFLEQAFLGYEQRFEREMPYLIGGSRWVQVTYLPDRGADGTVRGIYAVIQDITPRAVAAKKIAEKEATLQKVIDGVPALIGYWDENLKNVFSNQVYADYFGKHPDEIRGKHIRDVIGEALYQKNFPFIRAALSGEAQTFERTIPLRDGSERQTLSHYIPDLSDGKVRGFFVIVTDISEIKRLDLERRAIEMKLVASAKLSALGEMAGGVAHEINNPLAIIAGSAAKLRMDCRSGNYDCEAFVQRLEKIEATVDRAGKIVKGMLAFAHDGEDSPVARKEIGRILEETAALCQERFKFHSVTLKLPTTLPTDLQISCRPSQISQILLNLLNNAFDAVSSYPEKWIEMQVIEHEDHVSIQVKDSGSGIPAQVREKIFQPFFTTKEVGKGTGLGLSIAKGLAEKNGGSLTYLEGNPHTCFELRLPSVNRRKNAA